MTEKQFFAITANMHAQSAYQQQMLGHLVGLVHGLARAISKVGKAQGLDADDILKEFATGARAMTHALAEIPFPEFDWKADYLSSPDPPPSSTPPSET